MCFMTSKYDDAVHVFVSAALVYLSVAVIRFLQLQVFSGLAGEIHPLPFEPFNSGFLQQ